MSTDQHIAAVCADAGLGVMVGIYEVINDREQVPVDTLDRLTVNDVERHYEILCQRGLDAVEDHLIANGAG